MTLRRILQAQYRFGEFPCDNIDPANKEYFESMFRMEPMERIDTYMAMTPEVRSQYWSYWTDVRHRL